MKKQLLAIASLFAMTAASYVGAFYQRVDIHNHLSNEYVIAKVPGTGVSVGPIHGMSIGLKWTPETKVLKSDTVDLSKLDFEIYDHKTDKLKAKGRIELPLKDGEEAEFDVFWERIKCNDCKHLKRIGEKGPMVHAYRTKGSRAMSSKVLVENQTPYVIEAQNGQKIITIRPGQKNAHFAEPWEIREILYKVRKIKDKDGNPVVFKKSFDFDLIEKGEYEQVVTYDKKKKTFKVKASVK